MRGNSWGVAGVGPVRAAASALLCCRGEQCTDPGIKVCACVVHMTHVSNTHAWRTRTCSCANHAALCCSRPTPLVQCFAESVRGKKDWVNGSLAGAASGLALGLRREWEVGSGLALAQRLAAGRWDERQTACLRGWVGAC